MVRKPEPRPLKGAGGESGTKENPRHSAQPKRLRGLRRGIAAVTVGARTLPGAAKGVAVLGAWGGSLAGPPRRLPRAPVIVLSLFVVACSHFVSCRVVMRCHWVSPPCFLIVYAPAMRAVAYYALSGGGGRERASRFGAWDCLTCCGLACALRSSVRRLRCCAWYGVVGCGWHVECAAWFLSGGHLNE